MKKVFISAGDPSGDIHAARLMRELKRQSPGIAFIGIGGDMMGREGLESLVSISEISVVGFWEVAKKYSFFRKLLNRCKDILSNEQIDAFIPVDYPGFNIRLASHAKGAGIPVLYYIAPQLWAWGKNRAKKLASVVDKLFVVFPFEEEYFSRFGIDTKFIGHPLLDDPVFSEQFPGFSERQNRIALLPGSRKQEILSHIPLFRKISNIILKKYPDIEICIAKSLSVAPELFDKIGQENPEWRFSDNSRSLMMGAKAGLVKTGTSTLEAALCGMPFAMMYRTSPMTYMIGKKLVNLPYISLPNILANKFVVREFIQRDANENMLAEELIRMIEQEDYRQIMQEEFLKIREMLGKQGASETGAELILKSINK